MNRGEIDYHSHILPGLDDGSPNHGTSLVMAQEAFSLGYKRIVATPHYDEGICENECNTILKSVQELNYLLQKAGIKIEICPGSEIMLSPRIPQLLKEGKLMSLFDEGKAVLVEFPLSIYPLWADNVLYQIKDLGYTPVLAHPERYEWVEKDGDKSLMRLKNNFCKLQVNASSVTGKYGEKARKIAESLDKKDLVDFWGSDAHSERGYKILLSKIKKK